MKTFGVNMREPTFQTPRPARYGSKHDPARVQLSEAQTHVVRKSTAGRTSTKSLITQAVVYDADTPLVGPAFSNSCLQLGPPSWRYGPGVVVEEEGLFVVYDTATHERRRSLLGAPCSSTPQSPSSWPSPSSPSKRRPKVLVVKPVRLGRSPSKTDSIERILSRAGQVDHPQGLGTVLRDLSNQLSHFWLGVGNTDSDLHACAILDSEAPDTANNCQWLSQRRAGEGGGEDEVQARIDSALGPNRARPHAARLLANDPALVELDLSSMHKREAQARVAEQEVCPYSAEIQEDVPSTSVIFSDGGSQPLVFFEVSNAASPDDKATLFRFFV